MDWIDLEKKNTIIVKDENCSAYNLKVIQNLLNVCNEKYIYLIHAFIKIHKNVKKKYFLNIKKVNKTLNLGSLITED